MLGIKGKNGWVDIFLQFRQNIGVEDQKENGGGEWVGRKQGSWVIGRKLKLRSRGRSREQENKRTREQAVLSEKKGGPRKGRIGMIRIYGLQIGNKWEQKRKMVVELDGLTMGGRMKVRDWQLVGLGKGEFENRMKVVSGELVGKKQGRREIGRK